MLDLLRLSLFPPRMTGVKITPTGIPSVLRAVVTNMTNNAFSKNALELAHSRPFAFSFVMVLNSLLVRVDDMTLESFDGLGMIPVEILRRGTKKIAASLRIILIVRKIKENKHATSFK